MTAANLLYTDTEDALRDAVRRLFADRCKPEAVVALYDNPDADFGPLNNVTQLERVSGMVGRAPGHAKVVIGGEAPGSISLTTCWV